MSVTPRSGLVTTVSPSFTVRFIRKLFCFVLWARNPVLGIWGTTRGLARCAETANEKQYLYGIRSCSVGGPGEQ